MTGRSKPRRPAFIQFSSVRDLYLEFDRIFLQRAASAEVISACGHYIRVFDHHFFHFVELQHPEKPNPLLMASEKQPILSTASGFGPFGFDKQRALYLESAMECLKCPDEVWEDENLQSARWIYLKEYDDRPYSFTILLVGQRRGSLVPVTSFPRKKEGCKEMAERGADIPQKHVCRSG